MGVDADNQLHQEVLAELERDLKVPAGLGIGVELGVVTLTGNVKSFSEKWAAEQAVRRVRGVRAIAEDLIVDLPGTHVRNDTDLAKTAIDAVASNSEISERIRVEVEQGVITLRGSVDWDAQRGAAEEAVRHLTGVRGINNLIVVRPQPATRGTGADLRA